MGKEKKENNFSGSSFFCLVIFVGLSLFSFTACKTTRNLSVPSAVVPAKVNENNALLSTIQEQTLQFETLSARMSVNLNFPENEMSSRVDLKMVKDSAFQLSVQPLLGIEVFRMELSKDSVKVIDRLNKRYVADNYTNLRGQTTVDFNFYNLQALFTNHLFVPGQKVLSEKQYNRFKVNMGTSESEIRIKDTMDLLYLFMAGNDGKLLSAQISAPEDKYILSWKYSDFSLNAGKLFPMQMAVDLTANGITKGSVEMHINKMQINIPLTMEFVISAKYQRISLAQIIKSLSQKQ